ncbi:uncharacterized protein LOC135215363 [Macrobrachium nipponense]|uniref:uncharacterized protein LOC135215363 n=1 Tax=Macrobrachium nipponense TaxID=159736 RepID=UPI0030C86109
MGFAATGDAFCLRGDMALQGVQNCVKVIDDLLLHDEDYATHLHRIHEVLTGAATLRPLISPKRTFVWTPDHDEAFQRVKVSSHQSTSSRPSLTQTYLLFFRRTLHASTALDMPSCRTYGNGHLRLVQCGSRFLADAETRYATIELEMLAVVWAMSKCRLYLAGLQNFTLMTDHRPLIPILNSYTLDAIENSRLQRLKEKISPYIFTAVWRADESPAQDPNRILQDLCDAVKADPAYTHLLDCVTSGFPRNRYDLHNSLLPYWKLREDLYADGDLVLYGARVVVPAALRRRTLPHLQNSHRGVEATKRRARQSVLWPGIDSDIANTVRACEACQTLQSHLSRRNL